MSGQNNRFLQTGMTPRAWRMIGYTCVGMLLYGGILFAEIVQNIQLNKVDAELKAIELISEDQTKEAAASQTAFQPIQAKRKFFRKKIVQPIAPTETVTP